jgi:RNA polymerase sigma-70 factor (ECF subfamily)
MDKKDQLVYLIQNRDVRAFEELFLEYHSRLVLFALKFTGDLQTAKDIVQDTFLNLWDNAEKIKSSPKAYLFQSVKNNSLNLNRHMKIVGSVKEELIRKINSIEKSVYLDSENPYQSLLEQEMEHKVEEVVYTLPNKCRLIFNMSRKEHLKNKEIALKLNISVKAVEKQISKALSVLRVELSEYLSLLFIILWKNL